MVQSEECAAPELACFPSLLCYILPPGSLDNLETLPVDLDSVDGAKAFMVHQEMLGSASLEKPTLGTPHLHHEGTLVWSPANVGFDPPVPPKEARAIEKAPFVRPEKVEAADNLPFENQTVLQDKAHTNDIKPIGEASATFPAVTLALVPHMPGNRDQDIELGNSKVVTQDAETNNVALMSQTAMLHTDKDTVTGNDDAALQKTKVCSENNAPHKNKLQEGKVRAKNARKLQDTKTKISKGKEDMKDKEKSKVSDGKGDMKDTKEKTKVSNGKGGMKDKEKTQVSYAKEDMKDTKRRPRSPTPRRT